jgi:uncharacterized protein (DUF362 family)
MKTRFCDRRSFLRRSAALALGAPLALDLAADSLFAAQAEQSKLPGDLRTNAKVAIVGCRTYDLKEIRGALDQSFDLLGGLGPLVKAKTATIKINLTGTNFAPFLDRPVGETYMTHLSTASALCSALFAAGARRVRLVESNQSRSSMETTLGLAGWEVKELQALGEVHFENTRNLGGGPKYAHLKVPGGGYLFSSFELNHCYEETDVMVSLAKLKNHITAGVTLSMKNLFGLTPNSLYGDQAGSEEATAGRVPLHNRQGFEKIQLPGLKEGVTSNDPTYRVPHIIADICAARPIHLSVIDGITAVSGGEGPWCQNAGPMKVTTPGVLIVGLNPVSTDAVGTAVMGYENPRAPRGTKPFHFCDNHILLAEKAGLGTADLKQIDVRGIAIEKARYVYG